MNKPGAVCLLVGEEEMSWEAEPSAGETAEPAGAGSGPAPVRHLYLVTADEAAAREIWKEAAIACWTVAVRFRVREGGRARTWRGELAGITEFAPGPDERPRWLIVLRRSA